MVDVVAGTRRPRRYLVVGLVCAGIHNLIMFVTDAFEIHYMPALVLSFLVILPTAFALHSRYTFEREVAPVRFVRFAAGLLAAFPINFALMMILVSGLGFSVPGATLICTVALFVWNYAAARWAILLHRERGGQPS